MRRKNCPELISTPFAQLGLTLLGMGCQDYHIRRFGHGLVLEPCATAFVRICRLSQRRQTKGASGGRSIEADLPRGRKSNAHVHVPRKEMLRCFVCRTPLGFRSRFLCQDTLSPMKGRRTKLVMPCIVSKNSSPHMTSCICSWIPERVDGCQQSWAEFNARCVNGFW